MTSSRITRRAFSVVELLAGIMLITVIIGVAALALAKTVKHRELAARQVVATETVANIMEEIDSWPDDKITPENVAELTLPTHVAERLPESDLKIRLDDIDEKGISSKRIGCEIQWRQVASQPKLCVSAVTWRFPAPDGGDGS